MLQRLQIENFQCHDLVRMRLDPQITAIVGPSDTGKSAIIRALRWLVANRPLGTGFVQQGSKRAEVRIRIEGQDVRRIKSDNENKYRLGSFEYEAVGRDVPQSVCRFLKLDEVNFQGQHDAPFWFGLTPGELAKELNAIVDLEIIDSTSSRLASNLHRGKAMRRVIEERLAKAESALERLKFVPNLSREFEQLESMEREVTERRARRADLGALVAGVKKYRRTAKQTRRAAEGCLSVCRLGQVANRREAECLRLRTLLNSIEEAHVTIRPVPNLSGLDRLRGTLANKMEQLNELRKMVKHAITLDRSLGTARAEWKSAQTVIEEECGGVCPVCGRPM